MGMDVTGHLAYGIKLPEEFKTEDEDSTIWDFIDEIFWPYPGPGKYETLDAVYIGSCDEPEVIVTTQNYAVDWTAEPIDIENLIGETTDDLIQFCKDFDIECKPKWYLGCYCSY